MRMFKRDETLCHGVIKRDKKGARVSAKQGMLNKDVPIKD